MRPLEYDLSIMQIAAQAEIERATTEFHRKLYADTFERLDFQPLRMNLEPAKIEDFRNTREEGWFINIFGHIRADVRGRFHTDEEALKFVQDKAKQGSERHRRVLAYLTKRQLTK